MQAHRIVDAGHGIGLSVAAVVHDGLVARSVDRAEAAYLQRDLLSVRALGDLLQAERAETARLRAALVRSEARANRAESTLIELMDA